MPTSGPMNIAQAADLVDLSIQKIFMKSSDPESQYTKYFKTRTTQDYYEKDSSLTGLGEADFVDENAVLMQDVPLQGYKQVYTQNMVGIIIPFTFQMWKFGIKKRDLTNVVDELKKSIMRVKERLCAERLDNGFATSYTHYGSNSTRTISTTGGDGVAYFSSSHTREDGGTAMNNVIYTGTNYNPVLDYAGIKSAYLTASLFVDGRGNPRVGHLDTLVVKTGSTNAMKAKEILKAIKDGKIPESFDHDGAGVNAFEIIELDYLQNGSYWYMFEKSKALSEREGFQFVESQAPTVDPVNVVYKTKEIQTSATTLFDLGANDVARCWVASTSAGS